MEDAPRTPPALVRFPYLLWSRLPLSRPLTYGTRSFVSGMLKPLIGSLLSWAKAAIPCLTLRTVEDGAVSLLVIRLHRRFTRANNLCTRCVLLLEVVRQAVMDI